MDSDFQPWPEKYRPNSTKEIVGHPTAVSEVLTFIQNFKKGTKPLLLHGPPGNGKTSLVYAAANDLDFEIVEMNASDFRTAKTINETIGHAVAQQSLLAKKGKIILIDEIDGIYGTSDRGGLPAIYKILTETHYPVILTANNVWKTNLRSLRIKCKLVQMRKVNVRSIAKKLKDIADIEKITTDEATLGEIARIAEGDLRVAITEFQVIGAGKEQISTDDLKSLKARTKTVQIFDTLLTIFKAKDRKTIRDAFNNSEKSPDEILLWLAENIPKEYEKPEEIAMAFDRISRADVFKGRIIRNQSWGLMSYSNELMSLGVAAAKKEKYHKFTKYMPPGILIKMGRSKFKRALRDKTAAHIGELCHCSKKRAIKQFPYLSIIANKQGLEIGMDEDGLEYLKKFA